MVGKIPQAVIDEVLARTMLVDLVEEYLPLTKRGKNFLACCPFHQEKTPSFNVIPHKQFYYCFGCGASGNAISFLMNYRKLDFVAAIELLANRAGLTVPKNEKVTLQASRHRVSALELMKGISRYYQQTLSKSINARQYLAKRGVSEQSIKTFGLGYALPGWDNLSSHFRGSQDLLKQTGMMVTNEHGRSYDRYRDRIIFPICDRRGNIIGFGGRALTDDQQPKYLNSPETPYFRKSNTLYGYEHLPAGDIDSVILVEGYMDVITLYQYGIPTAVATLGTATTAQHLHLLLRKTQQLVFCFDGDAAGRRAALKALTVALPLLEEGQIIRFMFLPEQHDPDSWLKVLGKSAFVDKISTATTMDEVLFEQITQGLSLDDTGGRLQCVARAKTWFAMINQAVTFKALLMERLAALVQLPKEKVQALLQGNEANEQQQYSPTKSVTRPKLSAMRKALALLIQYPQHLLTSVLPADISACQQQGVALLIEIHRQLKPGILTAQLIEQWRERNEYTIISQLAMLPLALPESGVLAEFDGAIQQILKNDLQKRVNRLLFKARTGQLSQEERTDLQSMLKVLKAQEFPSSATHGT